MLNAASITRRLGLRKSIACRASTPPLCGQLAPRSRRLAHRSRAGEELGRLLDVCAASIHGEASASERSSGPSSSCSSTPVPLPLAPFAPAWLQRSLSCAAWAEVALQLMATHPAAAAEALKYDPSGGDEAIKNIAGVLYLGLVVLFVYRLLMRRAKKAREERLAGQKKPETPVPAPAPPPAAPRGRTTPLQAFVACAQTTAVAVVLYVVTTKADGFLYDQTLPDQYTARNITVTLRTAAVGTMYLATFIFSANAVGLFAFATQLLLFPDSFKQDDAAAAPLVPSSSEPQLPKVGYRTQPQELKRTFDSLERQQAAAAAAQQQSAVGSSSPSDSAGSATTKPADS